MASTNERVSILETKVDGLKEDITTMRKENREDHGIVMDKLDKLQDLKNYVLGGCVVGSLIVGWIITHIDWHALLENAIK